LQPRIVVSDIPERDLIVFGGSEGSIQPLKTILRGLPEDLPAAVFVVIHIAAETAPEIARSIANVGPLPTALARDGEAIEHGRIYVAPPDHHVLIRTDEIRVTRGPHENRVRPAIDPTLRTAAHVFDGRVIAAILSGRLNDGTYGAMVVKARGGTVIAQDPVEAEQASMPGSIVERSLADHVLKTAEIAAKLTSLVWSPIANGAGARQIPIDPGPDELERVSTGQELPSGVLAPFTCPECHGPLWLKQNGSLIRFRCHTGHAFTGEALLDSQREDLENALWSAVRALDEHADLLARLGRNAHASGIDRIAQRQLEHAQDVAKKSSLIKGLLL
jgi:two-component system chemotaxis response regulator CheB